MTQTCDYPCSNTSGYAKLNEAEQIIRLFKLNILKPKEVLVILMNVREKQ
jgi:hypothetical protein